MAQRHRARRPAEPIERLQQLGLGYLARSTARARRSRPASGSACSSPARCATAPPACSTCSTSPRSGCTPPTSTACSASSTTCWRTATRWCSSTTTCACCAMPTTSSRSAPARAPTGGEIIAQGTVDEVEPQPALAHRRRSSRRERDACAPERAAARGRACSTHGRHPLGDRARSTRCRPRSRSPSRAGRLTAVTGVSGSGKTTLVLESLVPALQAPRSPGDALPAHVRRGGGAGHRAAANLIDATPIGANVRSTVATYSGVLDDLRRAYAKLPDGQGARPEGGGRSRTTRAVAALPHL